jgi:hypothetical protein
MVTLATMESGNTIHQDFRQPQSFSPTGKYYPSRYNIWKDNSNDNHYLSLDHMYGGNKNTIHNKTAKLQFIAKGSFPFCRINSVTFQSSITRHEETLFYTSFNFFAINGSCPSKIRN